MAAAEDQTDACRPYDLVKGRLLSLLDDNTIHLWELVAGAPREVGGEKRDSGVCLQEVNSYSLPGKPGIESCRYSRACEHVFSSKIICWHQKAYSSVLVCQSGMSHYVVRNHALFVFPVPRGWLSSTYWGQVTCSASGQREAEFSFWNCLISRWKTETHFSRIRSHRGETVLENEYVWSTCWCLLPCID